MKQLLPILAIVALAYLAVLTLLRWWLQGELATAMAREDHPRYRQILFLRLTDLLVGREDLCLMRAGVLAGEGDVSGAKGYLSLIRQDKLDRPHLLEYYRTAFLCTLQAKDQAGAQQVQDTLKELAMQGDEAALALWEENQINSRLYLRFDPAVIRQLTEQLRGTSGPERGRVYLSLAKAHHLNGEIQRSVQCLHQARALLENTPYLHVIDAALADPGQLD